MSQRNFGPGEDPLAPIQTWPPADADALLAAGMPVPRPNPLSPRQIEVLQMLADGIAEKQIARILHITERTVRVHIEIARLRLQATNRTQAVANAIRAGWIT